MEDQNSRSQLSHDAKTIIVVLLLVLVYPIGIIFMWMWMETWPKWAKILLTVVPLLFMLLTIAILFPIYKLTTEIDGSLKPTPIHISPTPTPESTANWKTYENTKYGYSIKYPNEIKLNVSNEDAVELYRENVGIGVGMGDRGHGMVVYYRKYGAETIESQSRPIKNISINNYAAVRWTDNNKDCMEDVWIPNPNKQNTLRISFTTCAEKEPYNKIDFKLFNQILQTFTFD